MLMRTAAVGRTIVRRAAAAAALLPAACALHAAPAHAGGPGVGTPSVVTVGDSYISGEAGRWAGNMHFGASRIDALGARAYFDNADRTAELIPRCHRSRSAEAFIGGGVASANFACSGATTRSEVDDDLLKPGLDFADRPVGRRRLVGQALMLQRYATTHNVKLVAVSVGGNDFQFGAVVESCVKLWLVLPIPRLHCSHREWVQDLFKPPNVARVTARIKQAILNVHIAMARAGYGDDMYTILVQNYESVLPSGPGFGVPDIGFFRQQDRGCSFHDVDATWANKVALPAIDNAVLHAASLAHLRNLRTMDLQQAFLRRRLCERGVTMLNSTRLRSWRSEGAVDQLEWVNRIWIFPLPPGDFYQQESLHPNYWGQLALRSCLRQAYNDGSPRGGTCVRSANGLTGAGEPVMTLTRAPSKRASRISRPVRRQSVRTSPAPPGF
jgi:hypothetical protein